MRRNEPSIIYFALQHKVGTDPTSLPCPGLKESISVAVHRHLELVIGCERLNIEAVVGKRRPRRLPLVNVEIQVEPGCEGIAAL